MFKRALFTIVFSAVMLSGFVIWCVGCSVVLGPEKQDSTYTRLQTVTKREFDVDHEIQITWNEYQVPYINAATDDDAFWALGFTQAHLRLGQMELYRHLVQGRISELVGPFFSDLDYTLRLFDIDRAAEKIVENLPPEERKLLERYVAGINDYKESMPELPFEQKAFPLSRSLWKAEDVVRVSRLASVDFSWIVYASLLTIEDTTEQDAAIEAYSKLHSQIEMSGGSEQTALLELLFSDTSRFGSNSAVVGGTRTHSGKPMILSDPHLGITVPNFWLIAGLKSPSFNVVGLMIPGTPFFALGRNKFGAWGGTNLRSISSHLVKLSPTEVQNSKPRIQESKNRWWFNSRKVYRESTYGPIITDSNYFHYKTPLALDWLGHEGNGREFSTFLNLARTKSWSDFKNIFEGYKVPGLAMLYAGVDNTIGAVYAYEQPLRSGSKQRKLIHDSSLLKINPQKELPTIQNPDTDFIASCNNDITKLSPPLSLLPPRGGRFKRLTDILTQETDLTVERAMEIQQDTFSYSSRDLAPQVLKSLAALDGTSEPQVKALFQKLRGWNFSYTADSAAALAFEHFTNALFKYYVEQANLSSFEERLHKRSGSWKSILKNQLAQSAIPDKVLLKYAQETIEYSNGKVWGDVQKYRLQTPLGFIPILGSSYRFETLPAPGTSDSLLKSGGSFKPDKMFVPFGSQARHISDLSDPDQNFFVLLGGQDGWLKSPANTNQVALWQQGKAVKVPLDFRRFERDSVFSIKISPANN